MPTTSGLEWTVINRSAIETMLRFQRFQRLKRFPLIFAPYFVVVVVEILLPTEQRQQQQKKQQQDKNSIKIPSHVILLVSNALGDKRRVE